MSSTVLGVLLAILAAVIEGFAQVFLKKSSIVVSRRNLWVTLGVGLFVLESVFYTGALRHLDVSTAFPISSLAFVTVAVLSQWLLGEAQSKLRWVGVGLILLGTGLLVVDA
jgi:drug/metabolite transporter (DMT)-like permease